MFQLAELVVSTTGRDRGNYYFVVKILNERYVKLADGDKKSLENPKSKNIKHIKSTGVISSEISIRLAKGMRVRNEDLKKAIKDYENEEAN